MKLIVGLGNPGKKYERTRHNVGFLIVEALATALAPEGISKWELSKKFNAEICGATLKGKKIILAKPQTFMNESGVSVGLIGHFYKIPPADLIVVNDDKDLKLGDVRVQSDRSHAGHNGVRSIIEHLGTQNFVRVRVGVASENPKKMEDTSKFVLGKFGLFERSKVKEVIEKSVQEILKLLQKPFSTYEN